MTAVAVVGIGAMGGRMARRLLDAGHEVLIWNRTPDKMAQLTDLGAMPAELLAIARSLAIRRRVTRPIKGALPLLNASSSLSGTPLSTCTTVNPHLVGDRFSAKSVTATSGHYTLMLWLRRRQRRDRV